MVTKAQLEDQNRIIQELRELIVELQKKVSSLEEKQENYERQTTNNIPEENTWAKVLTGEAKKNEYHSNLLNVVGIEQKERKKKERSIMVFGLPISTASTTEEKQKDDENKVGNLLNSLGLGDDFSSQIEKVHRFKAPNETGKIAPIHVTIKLDGPSGPMYNATEIAKAAKCLKDNPNFKSVYVNPDLTQVQQIHLKRLIKERIQKNNSIDLTKSDFRYGIRSDQVVKIKNIIKS